MRSSRGFANRVAQRAVFSSKDLPLQKGRSPFVKRDKKIFSPVHLSPSKIL